MGTSRFGGIEMGGMGKGAELDESGFTGFFGGIGMDSDSGATSGGLDSTFTVAVSCRTTGDTSEISGDS